MDQAIAIGIITTAAALLGIVMGRVLESRSESRNWWRTQRRDAYAQLLVSEQRFNHLITIPESEKDIKAGWLVVQEAAAVVDLVAPDKVAETSKQFVARSRRYYVSLTAKPADASLSAGLTVAQGQDQARDERIRSRHNFVVSARSDLVRWPGR